MEGRHFIRLPNACAHGRRYKPHYYAISALRRLETLYRVCNLNTPHSLRNHVNVNMVEGKFRLLRPFGPIYLTEAITLRFALLMTDLRFAAPGAVAH